MASHIQRSPGSSFARRGVAVVYLALIMIVLIGVLGLAIDTGYVFLTAHQLQNAADSAALAGADEVPFSTAQAKNDAVTAAGKNSAAHMLVSLDIANDVVVGNYDRTKLKFTPDSAPYNACQVIARRTKGSPNGPLNLLFAPIFGITTSDVSRQATAMNSKLEAAILLLNSNASPALQLTGSGSDKISVINGGAVVVNSGRNNAIQWSGQPSPSISATELDIVGNDTAVSTGGVFPSATLPGGKLNLQTPSAPDPLALLVAPSQGPDQGGLKSQPARGWPPGYYPEGLPAGKLAGGVYYVDDGISLKHNESIDGSAGAMIYLHSGGISLKRNASINMNAMTTGPYAGISYFEDQANNSDITLRGKSGQTGTGTLYFPSAKVTIWGTPSSFGNQLIADTLVVQDNAQLNIDYDGRNPIYRHRAFLVK